MEITIFGKKTPRKIHGIKNCSIWICISKEIKEPNQGRKFNWEERENINSNNLLFEIKI